MQNIRPSFQLPRTSPRQLARSTLPRSRARSLRRTSGQQDQTLVKSLIGHLDSVWRYPLTKKKIFIKINQYLKQCPTIKSFDLAKILKLLKFSVQNLAPDKIKQFLQKQKFDSQVFIRHLCLLKFSLNQAKKLPSELAKFMNELIRGAKNSSNGIQSSRSSDRERELATYLREKLPKQYQIQQNHVIDGIELDFLVSERNSSPFSINIELDGSNHSGEIYQETDPIRDELEKQLRDEYLEKRHGIRVIRAKNKESNHSILKKLYQLIK